MSRSPFLLAVVVGGLGTAAHMGISSPVPLDAAVGDSYRFPVAGNNNAQGGGACHGKGAGAKYAWVWTPKNAGTCEIYQNCFDTLEASGSLKMSGGAAHGGGACSLYSCTGEITIPNCSPNPMPKLPETFGTCTRIAQCDDCTTKGSCAYTNAGGGTPVANPPELPPTNTDPFPPGVTVSKIRCGQNWGNANGRCGDLCTSDVQCTVAGETCYADLADCATGSPVNKPVRDPAADAACNSKQPHVADSFCATAGCKGVFEDYCHAGASLTAEGLTVTTCTPYATFAGETWGDVAVTYDVNVESLKAANSGLTGDLTVDTVLEIPGDCSVARLQVTGLIATDATESGASMATVAPALALLLLPSLCM